MDVNRILQDLLASFRDEAQSAIERALEARLPEVIRRAALPTYLTKHQLADLTGWSSRKIDYLKRERRIPFIQRGRTVLFRTSEVEAYLEDGHVPAKVPARS